MVLNRLSVQQMHDGSIVIHAYEFDDVDQTDRLVGSGTMQDNELVALLNAVVCSIMPPG
jgi:hypothetical protein